ncbi:NADH:flavin oxidoreductase/NADH oxidase [Pseudarthrobacter phenanthrenivorans]|uniref:NADH:flavin oxidoreductase/NADH oxidase n=1 Tax=Pseudarthrobacter phenanthrenivorans TaxID=361575 RepID=UPI00344E93A9
MARSEPLLFEPISVGPLTLPNRLWVAPMCQYSSTEGMPTDWHLAHLGSFAIGRAGLVMTEATAVAPQGRITPRCAGIWSDAHVQAWRRIVDFVHSQGVAIGLQIAHAGRKASEHAPLEGRGPVLPAEGGWIPVGPSAEPYGPLTHPHVLSGPEITEVVEQFAAGAARGVEAGFDLIEIHAAHGYLIHEFLSPLSNHREDEYGRGFEGRVRFLLEVVDAVKAAIPASTALVVRISASDWVEGGITAVDAARIAALLPDRGVHLVSVSSGGNDPRQTIRVGPGYQVPLARAVREGLDIPVGVAGLITSPQQAESVLVDGGADAVYVARQFLREPTFTLRAAAELSGELEWPWQYRMGKFAGSIP